MASADIELNEAAKAMRMRKLLEASRRISLQQDPAALVRLAVESVKDVLGADRAYCRLCDASGGESAQKDEYQKEFDKPEDKSRYLAETIIGADGQILAVIAAARKSSDPPFSQDDAQTLKTLAVQLASNFTQLNLQTQIAEISARKEAEMREQVDNLFREEALNSYMSGYESHGNLLRISPIWMKWTYWLLVAVFAVSIVYIIFGRINEYASGPAVVRIEGRIDLRTVSSGTVTAIEVQPGQRVSADQLLVRFYDAQETAELDRIKKEFDLQLVKSLNNPSDPALQSALVELRTQKDLAEARLNERSLRASAAGIIGDVRIRPGQHVAPGDILLSLFEENQKLSVVAILPGHYRPQLKPGMDLRLEPSGYRYAYQYLKIESIGDEVVGPNEVRRYLGQEIADAVAIPGPVVLVRAVLPSNAFVADGNRYVYHDGMQAKAEARVRSERIVFELVPGLKALF